MAYQPFKRGDRVQVVNGFHGKCKAVVLRKKSAVSGGPLQCGFWWYAIRKQPFDHVTFATSMQMKPIIRVSINETTNIN